MSKKYQPVRVYPCSEHASDGITVKGCEVCERLALEIRIAHMIAQALMSKGYTVEVNDGEDTVYKGGNVQAIIDAMQSTDEDYLFVSGTGLPNGWIRFIYGNDGYDVVNDYTTNLESIMAPVNKWCDRQQDREYWK